MVVSATRILDRLLALPKITCLRTLRRMRRKVRANLCPILADCDVSLLRVLGRAVRSTHFLEGTTIFQEDDVIHHLYFVYSGLLQLRTCDWNEGMCSRIKNLGIGSMVGNLDDTPTIRASSWLVAATDVQLLRMRSSAFHGIVRDCFPVVHELMAVYRSKNELFINSNTARGRRTSSKRYTMEVSRRLSIVGGVIQVFLILASLLCVYADLYNAGFQDNSTAILVSLYTLDACFLTKILLFIIMPQLVTLPEEYHRNSKKTYFKSTEFKLDVASCLPIELFSYLCDDFWLGLSLLRLNRILRVSTVYKYLKRYQKRATENLSFSTITLVIWFTVYIHYFTCLWYFIGLSIDRVEPRQSWVYNDTGHSLCNYQYICSFYFVLTSFAHNGVADIMPRQQIEVAYVSVLLIISKLLYVVYVGEFSNIVHYASFRAFSYYSKFLELQDFVKNNRVSPVLVALVNKYAVLLWREARGEQLPEFLVNAPLCLKRKVMSHAYKDFAEKHPVFKDCEPALVRNIIGYLRQYYHDENMYVVKQTEITNCMYHVHTGGVQEISENYDEDEDEGLNLRVYTAGEFFGIEQGLKRDKPFDHSYRTTIKSQILTLHYDDWEYLLKHFPDSKKIIDNYQWTSRGGDDKGDKPRRPDRASTPYGPEKSRKLDTPGGSKTSVEALWGSPEGPSDGPPGGSSARPPSAPSDRTPSGSPDPRSGKPPDIDPSEEADSLIEIKRSLYPERPSTDGTSKIKRESKSVKLRDEVRSSLFLKEPSVETMGDKRKSALRISDKIKADTSVKFNVDDIILPASSSTELFERIRNAAKAVDEMQARRDIDDNENISPVKEETKESKVTTASTAHHSVEEYLAHKFKMRESYKYQPKREDDDKSDTEVRMSPSKRTRKKLMSAAHDGSGREHFRHTQLAETEFHIHSPQSLSTPVLNLERPLDDHTPSKLSLASLAAVSELDLQRRKSTLEKNVDSQATSSKSSIVKQVNLHTPMTSKKAVEQSGKTEPYNSEDESRSEGTGTSKNPEENLIDRSSDLTLKSVTAASAATPTLPALSDAGNEQTNTLKTKTGGRSVSVITSKLEADADNHNVETASTAFSNPTPLLAIEATPKPTVSLQLAEETQTLSEKLVTVEHGTSTTTIRRLENDESLTSTQAKDSKNHAALSKTEVLPQTPSNDGNMNASRTPPSNSFLPVSPPLLAIEAPPEPEAPLKQTLPETQTLSTELVTTEHDPSITTMRLLEQETAPTPIVAPPEDQVSDLAALSEAETIFESVQSTSKATDLDNSSKEKLADNTSLKTKSKKEMTDTLKLKSSKEKTDEMKSDQDKDTEDKEKERKEKKE